MHVSSLKTHFSDISDSEEKVKEELVSVDAVYQQSNKVVL